MNCPSQETEVTSTPTRPVDNVVITTKGLQDRNNLLLDGKTVENKGKLILSVTKIELDNETLIRGRSKLFKNCCAIE